MQLRALIRGFLGAVPNRFLPDSKVEGLGFRVSELRGGKDQKLWEGLGILVYLGHHRGTPILGNTRTPQRSPRNHELGQGTTCSRSPSSSKKTMPDLRSTVVGRKLADRAISTSASNAQYCIFQKKLHPKSWSLKMGGSYMSKRKRCNMSQRAIVANPILSLGPRASEVVQAPEALEKPGGRNQAFFGNRTLGS